MTSSLTLPCRAALAVAALAGIGLAAPRAEAALPAPAAAVTAGQALQPVQYYYPPPPAYYVPPPPPGYYYRRHWRRPPPVYYAPPPPPPPPRYYAPPGLYYRY
ncbi:hypothetical protein SAMN02745194_04318 [Roseomonas rosea]|uniref:PXPV repeat-containing protein n=1 Tax=Muricoccus roseus TaxID=198092 RepID=A0A1M6Q7E2_9PROT|nr:hypothetical protein [Roseomonas rosea]SHK16172.1 hypothetical protein SAMN02745194_04318 [Roseomonas rosea]